MAKKKDKYIGFPFSTIHAEPKFQCPFGCSGLTNAVGHEEKTQDIVWKCERCGKFFKPVFIKLNKRTKIKFFRDYIERQNNEQLK